MCHPSETMFHQLLNAPTSTCALSEMSGGAVFNNGFLDARDVRFVGNAAAVKGMALYNTKYFNPYGVVFEGNHILCAPGMYAYEKVRHTCKL